MALHNPLNEGTDAAGGYLTPTASETELIFDGALATKYGEAQSLAGDVDSTDSKATEFSLWVGDPVASFVDELAPIPTSGIELGVATLHVKKLGVTIPMSRELFDDAKINLPASLLEAAKRAFRTKIGSHILGLLNGAPITTSFDNALADTDLVVELGTGPRRFANAISEAMGEVDAAGHGADAAVVSLDSKRMVREETNADGDRLVYDNNDPLHGIQKVAYSKHLNPLNPVSGEAAGEKVVAVVFDSSRLSIRVRNDLEMEVLREATVGGVNLADRHMIAVKFWMRIGAMQQLLNQTACKIVRTVA